MLEKYTLEAKAPKLCIDSQEWEIWFETADRQVDFTTIDDFQISTVFLGEDQNPKSGPPLLFETAVFRTSRSGMTQAIAARCSTWQQAEKHHAETVKKVTEANKFVHEKMKETLTQIQKEWKVYKALFPKASDTQLQVMKSAFYSGAIAMVALRKDFEGELKEL